MEVYQPIGYINMKHHGNYLVDTPEELLLNLFYNSEESKAYANASLQRAEKKHKNSKRHKEKRNHYDKKEKTFLKAGKYRNKS